MSVNQGKEYRGPQLNIPKLTEFLLEIEPHLT